MSLKITITTIIGMSVMSTSIMISFIFNNFFIALFGIIISAIIILAGLYFSKGKITDERISMLNHKASDITLRIFSIIFILLALSLYYKKDFRIIGLILLSIIFLSVVVKGIIYQILKNKYGE